MLGRNSHDTYMWCTKPSPWQCRTLRLFLFSIMLLMWTHVPSAPENCLSSSRDRGGIMDALLRKSQQDPRWKSCESCEEKHDSWFMTFLWNQDFPVGHFRSDGQSLIMANVSKWACQTRSLNLKILKKNTLLFQAPDCWSFIEGTMVQCGAPTVCKSINTTNPGCIPCKPTSLYLVQWELVRLRLNIWRLNLPVTESQGRHRGWNCDCKWYPLVNVYIAIENGHWNSGFTQLENSDFP